MIIIFIIIIYWYYNWYTPTEGKKAVVVMVLRKRNRVVRNRVFGRDHNRNTRNTPARRLFIITVFSPSM